MTNNSVGMETSDVRKRVKAAIDESRRAAAARRAEIDAAGAAYERFRKDLVEPLVQKVVQALKAEGYAFTVFTPAGGPKMTSTRSPEDSIEFALDTSGPHAVATLRVHRSRGRRVLEHERPIRGEERVEELTENDVLTALLQELTPFIEK